MNKPGAIFSFKIKENLFMYFQYLGDDNFQLGSNCIAIFNYKEAIEKRGNIEDIINSGIWFISLTWIKRGIRDGFYKEIGWAIPVKTPNEIYFKGGTEDFKDENDLESDIYYRRQLNSSKFTYFKNNEEYIKTTKNDSDDGASMAQGQRRYIIYKLFGEIIDL